MYPTKGQDKVKLKMGVCEGSDDQEGKAKHRHGDKNIIQKTKAK